MALRLVYAEDNYLVREGTAALLSRSPELDVVALAQDLGELLAAVERHRPDVVLTDIRMPPTWTTEGIEAARRIRRENARVGVVVLSQYAEDAYAVDLLKEGAGGLGYLLKERVSQLDQLVTALRAVAAGDSVVDRQGRRGPRGPPSDGQRPAGGAGTAGAGRAARDGHRQEQPGASPRPCSSASGRWRRTSTPCSRSSLWVTSRSSTGASWRSSRSSTRPRRAEPAPEGAGARLPGIPDSPCGRRGRAGPGCLDLPRGGARTAGRVRGGPLPHDGPGGRAVVGGSPGAGSV